MRAGRDSAILVGYCCKNLTLEDSHREYLRLNKLHEPEIVRTRSRDELGKLH